jgi:hypothetical protein
MAQHLSRCLLKRRFVSSLPQHEGQMCNVAKAMDGTVANHPPFDHSGLDCACLQTTSWHASWHAAAPKFPQEIDSSKRTMSAPVQDINQPFTRHLFLPVRAAADVSYIH